MTDTPTPELTSQQQMLVDLAEATCPDAGPIALLHAMVRDTARPSSTTSHDDCEHASGSSATRRPSRSAPARSAA